MSISYRDLTTLDDYARVVELERIIWGPGYDEVVPVPILAITVMRGGILVGAFDDTRMIGFVYSIAGLRHGQATHWSHMLGVLDEYRSEGVGRQLKILQRERALALGIDLIEWTYDPMQAMNAHLNFTKLGVRVEEYEENVYGESGSPLHRGNPTDRFVAQWWIRRERERFDWNGAVPVNRIDSSREQPAPTALTLDVDAPAVRVQIPMGFTDMLMSAPEAALEWRMATRQLFTTYFGRGYHAVDFALDRGANRGSYLLIRS